MDELSKLFGGAEQAWTYIKQYAAKAGCESTRIVLESYYVVKSADTPTLDKTIIIAALGYQLLPNDLISREKHGWLGLLDNGAAIAMAYKRVKANLNPQIENQVNALLEQWFGPDSEQPACSNTYNEQDSYKPSDNQQQTTTPDNNNNIDVRPVNPPSGYDDNEDVVID